MQQGRGGKGLQAGTQLAQRSRGETGAGQLEGLQTLQQGGFGARDGEAPLTQLLPQL